MATCFLRAWLSVRAVHPSAYLPGDASCRWIAEWCTEERPCPQPRKVEDQGCYARHSGRRRIRCWGTARYCRSNKSSRSQRRTSESTALAREMTFGPCKHLNVRIVAAEMDRDHPLRLRTARQRLQAVREVCGTDRSPGIRRSGCRCQPRDRGG